MPVKAEARRFRKCDCKCFERVSGVTTANLIVYTKTNKTSDEELRQNQSLSRVMLQVEVIIFAPKFLVSVKCSCVHGRSGFVY